MEPHGPLYALLQVQSTSQPSTHTLHTLSLTHTHRLEWGGRGRDRVEGGSGVTMQICVSGPE